MRSKPQAHIHRAKPLQQVPRCATTRVRRGLDVCIVHAHATAVVTQLLHSMPPVRRVVRRSHDHGAPRRRRATRPSFAAATRSAGSFAARCNRPEICIATFAIAAQTRPEVLRERWSGIAATSAQDSASTACNRSHTEPSRFNTPMGMRHATRTCNVRSASHHNNRTPRSCAGLLYWLALVFTRWPCRAMVASVRLHMLFLLAPTHTRALNNLWQTTCGTPIAPAPGMDRLAVCNA